MSLSSKLSKTFYSVKKGVIKYDAEILRGFGYAGIISAVVSAAIVTPKALRIIDDKKEEAKKEDKEYTKMDAVKDTWYYFLPPVLLTATSIACIEGSSKLDAKKRAALATAYKLSEEALRDYKLKADEILGEKKAREIEDAVAKKHLEDNPVNNTQVILTGNGDFLCYDAFSKRYFRSTQNKIEAAAIRLNKDMYNGFEQFKSMNDFFYEIGLESLDWCDNIGWNINNEGAIDIYFTYNGTEAGEPCICLNYMVEPREDYCSLK